MVLFTTVKIKRYILLSLAAAGGIIAGGASMMYLFTIPDVVYLAALQVSQVYALTGFGIMFFSMLLGANVSLFIRDIILKERIGGRGGY